MNKYFVKIIVAIYCVILTFIILEVVLRIGSFFYLKSNEYFVSKNLNAPDRNLYRILCLGDSFTYGVGAPRNESYPSQLFNILNDNIQEYNFKVINYGYGGQNTSQLLNKLTSDINDVNPQLIIILTGYNNIWNYWGLSDYRRNNVFYKNAEKYLYHSRVYKLGVLLYHRLKKLIITKNEEKLRTDSKDTRSNKVEYKIKEYNSKLLEDYLKRGEYDKAIEIIHAGLRKDPDNAQYYNQLGSIYKNMAKYDQAIYNFLRSIKINSSDATPYIGLGWAYKDMKKYTEAIKYFNKVLMMNDSDIRAYHGLGWVYIEMDDYDMALKSFSKGLEYHPRDSDCYCGIGVAYMERGEYDEAKRWLLDCLDINDSNPTGIYKMGRIYVISGNYDDALWWFRQGIDKAPYFGGNYCGIAEIYEEKGNYKKALLWYKKGLSVDATFPGIFFGLSRIANKSGENREVYDIISKYGRGNKYATEFLSGLEKKSINNIDNKTEINNWIKSDIKNIVDICRGRGIDVMIQNYPFYTDVNLVLKLCADEYGIPFVDNYAYFDSIFDKGANEEEIMAGDGVHCTAEGYSIIAENIFKQIVKEDLVE